ncbi:hypothetical protein OIV83_005240 [Microbotryomycetes sp. JL201]|nr:hypothetical protein OIV83_005240 [Microbotryomycetes sp. JL201]
MPPRLVQLLSIAAASSALLLPPAVAAKLHVNDGKFSLIDSVGIASATLDFSSARPAHALDHRQLQPGDSLRLTFAVTQGHSDETGEGAAKTAQPQQAVVLWQAQSPHERGQPGRDHQSVVKVRKGGKAKWELEIARAPADVLSISRGPISLTLLVGSPDEAEAVRVALGTVTLPSSLALPHPYPAIDKLPKSWEAERYLKMPELQHTFRPQERRISPVIALGGTLVVLAPWIVFFAILLQLGSLDTSLLSLNIIAFLCIFCVFEGLIFIYWTSLKLLPTLPYFSLLSVVTAVTGRRALGDLRARRLEAQRTAADVQAADKADKHQ